MDIEDVYPELVYLRLGDRYVQELVKYDDVIDDVENAALVECDGRLWLDLTDEDRALIGQVEADRLAYELRTLGRWWGL